MKRYYVEKLSKITPNKQTGIVKLTYAVSDEGKDEEVVQLLVSAGDLQAMMQMTGETMQKTFSGMGPGGRGRGPGGKGGPAGPGGKGGPGPMKAFKDLTKDD